MSPTRSCVALLFVCAISLPAVARAAPPTLDAIDVSHATAGDRVRLTGGELGDPSTSRVEIGGIPAPTATWTATAITAYVPAGAAPGETTVRVVTAEGTAARALTLARREPVTDRIAWRFVGDASSPGQHPPGLRSDGALVMSDQAGFVYAIDRDGTVRWIVDSARSLGVEWARADRGPIAIGADDTAYVAVTSGTREHVLALFADGTVAWTKTLSTGFLSAGPSIGPDGDVYVLHAAAWIVSTDEPGPSSGMMRLRSTDGGTVWATRGEPVITQVPFEGAPIAFGAASPGGPVDRAFVFTEHRALSGSPGDPQLDAVRAFALDDGRETFVAVTAGPTGSASPLQVWPAVRDDGIVLASSFLSSGEGQRVRFLDPASGAFVGATSVGEAGGLGSPLAGRDGRTFVVRSQSWVDAFDAEGRLLWERRVTGSPRPNRPSLSADRATLWVPTVGRTIGIATEDGAVVDDVRVPGSAGVAEPIGCAFGLDAARARAYYVGCFAGDDAAWELSAIDLDRTAPAADAGIPHDDAGPGSDAGATAGADAGATDAGLAPTVTAPGCSVGSRSTSPAWTIAGAVLAVAMAARGRRRSRRAQAAGASSWWVVLVLPALAACSEPPLADTGDGGLPPVLEDGGTPPLDVDGGTQGRCSPREIVRHADVLLDQAVVGSDGRVAITWLQTDVTEEFSETRSFLEIVGAQGTSEVIAAKIPGASIVAIEGGYVSATGAPGPHVHVLDLDGAVARAPIAVPHTLGPALVSQGRRLRGEAWSSASTPGGLVFELDLDAATPEPRAIAEATSGVLARRFDRELVAIGAPAEAVIERALPTGTMGEEIAWPAGIEPIAAELDAAHDRWLVLGAEPIVDGSGGRVGSRPAIVSVSRDGVVEVRSIEVDVVMRSVVGSLAIGPDAALFAVDDLHGNAYLVRMPLDTLEPSAAEPLDGVWRGRALWHAATESFALVSATLRDDDGTTAIVYRCGL